MKKIVKSKVSIHDKTQFESTFDYKFFVDQQGAVDNHAYQLDLYFIFPKQLGINRSTYLKEDFYKDLRSRVRFNPKRIDRKHFKNDQNPWTECFLRLKSIVDKGRFDEFPNEIKWLCCVYETFCKSDLEKLIKPESLKAMEPKEFEETWFEIEILLKKARLFITELHLLTLNISEKQQRELNKVKSYAAISFYKSVSKIFSKLKFSETQKSTPFFTQVSFRIQVWARYTNFLVYKYCDIKLNSKLKSYQKESFLVKIGGLKRYVNQVLFLNLKPRHSQMLWKQIGYMTAAGVSALWAFIANFLIWRKLNFSGFGESSIDEWLGFSGITLLFAVIVSYALKDRIKEIGRLWINKGVLGYSYDFEEKIWYASKKKILNVGFIKEGVSFIVNHNKLPSFLREKLHFHFEHPNSDVELIHYTKKIFLESNIISSVDYPVSSLKDISRFDLSRFLNKFDDPETEFLVLDKMGKVYVEHYPKVYYFDAYYSYISRGDHHQIVNTHQYIRFVLDKTGLLRIEKDISELLSKKE